jgi:hypothetical protein
MAAGVWGESLEVGYAVMTGMQPWQPVLGVDGQRWEMRP